MLLYLLWQFIIGVKNTHLTHLFQKDGRYLMLNEGNGASITSDSMVENWLMSGNISVMLLLVFFYIC